MSKSKTSDLLKELMLDDVSDDDDNAYSEVGASPPADRPPTVHRTDAQDDVDVVRRMTRQFIVDSDDDEVDREKDASSTQRQGAAQPAAKNRIQAATVVGRQRRGDNEMSATERTTTSDSTTASAKHHRRDRLAALNLDGSSSDDGNAAARPSASRQTATTSTRREATATAVVAAGTASNGTCTTPPPAEPAAATDAMKTSSARAVNQQEQHAAVAQTQQPPAAPPAYLSDADMQRTEALRGVHLVEAIESANDRYRAATTAGAVTAQQRTSVPDANRTAVATAPPQASPTEATSIAASVPSLRAAHDKVEDCIRSPSPTAATLTMGVVAPASDRGGDAASRSGVISGGHHPLHHRDDDDASLTFHDESTVVSQSASKSHHRHEEGEEDVDDGRRSDERVAAARELWLSPERVGEDELSFAEVTSPPPTAATGGDRNCSRRPANADDSSRTFEFYTATTTMTASPERPVPAAQQPQQQRRMAKQRIDTAVTDTGSGSAGARAHRSTRQKTTTTVSPPPEAHREHPVPLLRSKPAAAAQPSTSRAAQPKSMAPPPPQPHGATRVAPSTGPASSIAHRTSSAEGRRSTTSGAASSYAALQTMYRRAVHRREAVEDHRARQRAHTVSAEMKQCTFKPTITAKGMKHKAKQLDSSHGDEEPTSEQRLRLLHDARATRGEQDLSECTFAPQIEPISEQLVQRARNAAAAHDGDGAVDGARKPPPLTAAERLYLDGTRRAVELECNAEVALLALRGGKEPLKRRDEDIALHIATLHQHQLRREATLKRLVEENALRTMGRRSGRGCVGASAPATDVLVDPDAVVHRLLHRGHSSSSVSAASRRGGESFQDASATNSSTSSRIDDRRPTVNAVSRELAARRRRAMVSRWFACLVGGGSAPPSGQQLDNAVDSVQHQGDSQVQQRLTTSRDAMMHCAPPSVRQTNEFKCILEAIIETEGSSHGEGADATSRRLTLDEFTACLLRYEQRRGPQPWACRSPEEAAAIHKRMAGGGRRASSAHQHPSNDRQPSEVHNRLYERQTQSTWCKSSLSTSDGVSRHATQHSNSMHDGTSTSLRQHKVELLDARQRIGERALPMDVEEGSTMSSASRGNGVRSRSRQHSPHRHVDPRRTDDGSWTLATSAGRSCGADDDDVLIALDDMMLAMRRTRGPGRCDGDDRSPPRAAAPCGTSEEVEMSAERCNGGDRSAHVMGQCSAGKHDVAWPDATVRELQLGEAHPSSAAAHCIGGTTTASTVSGAARSMRRPLVAAVANVAAARQHASSSGLVDGSATSDGQAVGPDDLLLNCAELQVLHARGGGDVMSVREQRALVERKKLQRLRDLGRKLAASQLSS